MSNYKRTHRFMGKPELLEPVEREYQLIWIQPVNERQVPAQVRVYEKEDGWRGHRVNGDPHVELFWMRGLWKEVPDPLDGAGIVPLTDDDDEETLEEVKG